MLIDFNYLSEKYKIKATGVLHVGAHIGQEAEAYNAMGVNNVVWIEANPAIYSRLVENVSKYPQHRTYNYCVSDKSGEAIFHVSSNDGQSSSILELGTHAVAHPDVTYTQAFTVNTKRLDEIYMDWTGLNFLNMDIQGVELMALRGMGEKLRQFDYAYIEVNKAELYKGCGLEEQVTAYLGKFGLKPVEQKIFNQWGWGDVFYIK